MTKIETTGSQSEKVEQEQPHSTQEAKVIVHLASGELIKGHLELTSRALALPIDPYEHLSLETLSIRPAGTKTISQVPLESVKSVFFVKSFRGDPERKDIRFYANGPEVGKIWVEVRFKDNEVLEGLIENSVTHLLGNTFVLKPTDIRGNNLMVVVNKAEVRSFRVLGIRGPREFGN